MEKSRKLNTTKFKLVIYWGVRPDGITPFTQYEKDRCWHRKPLPSFDFIYGQKGETYTRHDLGHQACLDKITKDWSRIEYAELYMNDFQQMLEIQCAVWSKQEPLKNKICEIITEINGNNVIAVEVVNPIKVAPYSIELYKSKRIAA